MLKNNLKLTSGVIAILVVALSVNYANAATTKKNTALKSLFPTASTKPQEARNCVGDSKANMIVDSLIKKGLVSEEKKSQVLEIVKDCRKNVQKQNKATNTKKSTPSLLKTPSIKPSI